MKCPYCASKSSKVVDKRDKDEDGVTRRRRECLSCYKRFTTYERIENIDLHVVKKDGSREQFSREKLFKSVGKAVANSKVDLTQLTRMVDSIEMELLHLDSTEVKSTVIGALVLERLKKIDPVGYMRFASVYNNFKSLDDFRIELDSLSKE